VVPPNAESSSQGKAAKTDGMSVVVALLTAVGAGISVLGFVAFFGAAVEWVRFDQAHLSGNEAVAVIPRSVLIANGANFLVPAVLFAVAFVGLLYLAEAVGEWLWRRTSPIGKARDKFDKKRNRADVLGKIARDAEGRADAARRRRKAAKAASAADNARIRLERKSRWDPKDTDQWRRDVRLSLTLVLYAVAGFYALDKVDGLDHFRLIFLGGIVAVIVGFRLIVAPIVGYLIARYRVKRKEGRQSAWFAKRIDALTAWWDRRWLAKDGRQVGADVLRVGIPALLIVASVLVGWVLWRNYLGESNRVIALSLALAAATAISLAVLTKTDSFVWLALTAFFAVGIVDGAITYYRTVDTPKVEPAALLRSDRRPLYGFYVAETSDRIYLGARGEGVVHMVSVPRDEVSDMSIGPLSSPRHAKVKGLAMALDLCRNTRAPSVASSDAGAPNVVPQPKCSGQVVANLKDRLIGLNRRQQVQKIYKGVFVDVGGTVRFRAEFSYGKPVIVLRPPRSGHSWRFKDVPAHCSEGDVVVTNHAPFKMAVNNEGEFHTPEGIHGPPTIHGHSISISCTFVKNRVEDGTFRIRGTVGRFTHCDTGPVEWKAYLH